MCTSASSRRGRALAAALAGLWLAGCAVGPNFTPPAPPKTDKVSAAPTPDRLFADEAAQSIRLGAPTDPAWWRLFGAARLDAMVEAGLQASPTLASARAALEGSRDQARAGAGVFLPSLGASASATRERLNLVQFGQSSRGPTLSLYSVAGAVSYPLDLFGGERRQVEALNAQAGYQRHALGAAYLTLTGGIVDTAIARAGYVDEADTLARIVRLDREQRDILAAEYQAGHGALSAELAAEQQLDADQASLAQAMQRLAAAQTLLQTLMGREPAEAAPPPPELADLTLPADAPVSLPSQLVRQRPDILQAEANLHAASAEVGVATAAMFPSISLTGDYGRTGLSLASLGSPAATFWAGGPSVDIPVFRGGALWFGRKAALAGYRKAAADYRQTVLAALEQVSDALKALETDADVAAASRTAADAADLSDRLAEANRTAGLLADYDAIGAEIAAARAHLALDAARTERMQDVVALYLACGGGWTGREPARGATTP
jgi:NodT family efflux transporter outer membrane factor (OMF) lipoprotein